MQQPQGLKSTKFQWTESRLLPPTLVLKTVPPVITQEPSTEVPKDAINCVLLGNYESGLRDFMDYLREKGTSSGSKILLGSYCRMTKERNCVVHSVAALPKSTAKVFLIPFSLSSKRKRKNSLCFISINWRFWNWQ
jgi:hypothetical protein